MKYNCEGHLSGDKSTELLDNFHPLSPASPAAPPLPPGELSLSGWDQRMQTMEKKSHWKHQPAAEDQLQIHLKLKQKERVQVLGCLHYLCLQSPLSGLSRLDKN